MAKIVPELDFEEFKTFLDSQVFSVHDMLLADEDNFNMYFDKFYTYMKQGFEREEVRTYPIKFRFTSNEAEPIKTMQIRHMIINMIYWLPFIKMGRVEELNSSHILDPAQLTNSYTENWINTLIIDPYRKFYSNKKMNRIVERILYMSGKISNDFNTIMAMSINTESFIKLAEEDERVNQIIRTKLTPGMQPKDIEEVQHNLMEEFISILKKKDNCLKPILNAGAGIKDKQLSEFAIIGGLKPDVNGNTIPIPINSNFLVNGLNTVGNYYVDSQAGRKSVILNKTSIARFLKKHA